MSALDVAHVRGLFGALGDGWCYLNFHDTPQIPERVTSAVARSFRLAPAVVPAEPASGSHSRPVAPGTPLGAGFAEDARVAIADLVGASASAVILGPSLPVLYRGLAAALRPRVRAESSVVLAAMDDPQLTAPFAQAVRDVRWAQPDLGTGELPGYQFEELVDGTTRLVSFSWAHACLGTVAPVDQIVEATRERSRAWVLVDVTAVASYRLVDITALNADIVAVDLGQLGGPQLAALVFRDEFMFKRLDATHLEFSVAPALAGGVSPLVDHYADLVENPGTRRGRLTQSMAAVAEYAEEQRADLYNFLGSLYSVHILGYTGEAAAHASSDRLPRLSFGVRGVPAATVQQRLFDHGLVTTLTPASDMLRDMGAEEIGGAVTVSLAPFNTLADIEKLVRAVASLA